MASSSTTTPGVWSRLLVRSRTRIRDWSTLTTLLPRPFLSRIYTLVWKVRERRSSLAIFCLFGLVRCSSSRLPLCLCLFFPAMSSIIHHLLISLPPPLPPPPPSPFAFLVAFLCLAFYIYLLTLSQKTKAGSKPTKPSPPRPPPSSPPINPTTPLLFAVWNPLSRSSNSSGPTSPP